MLLGWHRERDLVAAHRERIPWAQLGADHWPIAQPGRVLGPEVDQRKALVHPLDATVHSGDQPIREGQVALMRTADSDRILTECMRLRLAIAGNEQQEGSLRHGSDAGSRPSSLG